ncbi:MAG: polysaccharide deacetylase family protein [Nocardioides sp.]
MLVMAVAVWAPVASEAESTSNPTVVTFTFDDGFSTQVRAADVLASHAMAGTFYVNSGSLAWDGYMTPLQMRHLADDGHEIAGHALSHVSLTELTPDQVKHEVCGDRAAMAKLGFPVANFAYPYAADSPAVAQVIRDCGYNSARDAGGLFVGPDNCEDCPVAEDLPPTDRLWSIRTHDTVRPGLAGLEAIKEYVTRAESTGGWVPLVFHRICDGCAEESMSVEHFTEFVEWLEQRPATTSVRTVAEVVGGDVRPVVGEAPGQVGGLPPFDTAGADSGRDLNEAVAFSVGGVGIGQFQVVMITLSIAIGLIAWSRFKTRRLRRGGDS